MLLLSLVILFFTGYTILLLYYWLSWKAIPGYLYNNAEPSTNISIIIPARNEEDNIGRLLESLMEQSYPAALTEIIVIDDHSTDRTAEIVRTFGRVKLLRLEADAINSYKKKAIETGITAAGGELIITTDADCQAGKDWLMTLVAFYEKEKPVFIAAPVAIDCGPNLLEVFQAYDFAVLQGITGASVYKKILSMCNGANLAYPRTIFFEVNGFAGIDDIASGDDMLLMHKIATRYPNRVAYLKSAAAIVYTQPMKTWKAFFNQRIRWASKATRYDDKRITAVLALVYFFNLSFFALLIAGCWDSRYLLYATALWLAKTLVEFPFVWAVSRFFGKAYLMKYFLFFQPIHILYTIISGFFGQLGKYEWKGRKVG